jgi:hypothetical protein
MVVMEDNLVTEQSRTNNDIKIMRRVYEVRYSQVSGFGSQNPCEVLTGTRGAMWHHHKTCVDAMQSREEVVVVRSTNLELDHSAFRIKWCTSNYLGIG